MSVSNDVQFLFTLSLFFNMFLKMSLLLFTFQLRSTQKIRLDSFFSAVVFETLCVNGHTYFLRLSREQFLAFNDIFVLMNGEHVKGHFPLGRNIWLHVYDYAASLHDSTKHGQPYFKFQNFHQYLTFAHRRVL